MPELRCHGQVPPRGLQELFWTTKSFRIVFGEKLFFKKKDLNYKDGFLFSLGSKLLVSPRFYCFSTTSPAPLPPCIGATVPKGLAAPWGSGTTVKAPNPPSEREPAQRASSLPQTLKIRSEFGFRLIPLSAAKQMFHLFWQGLGFI